MISHNSNIVNNEEIEKDWIVEVETKLAKIINEGELQKGSELHGKWWKMLKWKTLTREYASTAIEINDK